MEKKIIILEFYVILFSLVEQENTFYRFSFSLVGHFGGSKHIEFKSCTQNY